MDREERNELKSELQELIAKYLAKANPHHQFDDDGLVATTFDFFGGHLFSDNLVYYLQSSVSALAAFAKGEVVIHLKKHMSGFEYESLCNMLKQMVEFCRIIESNPIILAQFDQVEWEVTDTSQIPTASIVLEKAKYEVLLKSLNS